MFEVQNPDEYFRILLAQLKRHGQAQLKFASVNDPLAWKFLVGFESPEGTWGVSMRSLRSWAWAQGRSDPALLYGTRLKEAFGKASVRRRDVWERLK